MTLTTSFKADSIETAIGQGLIAAQLLDEPRTVIMSDTTHQGLTVTCHLGRIKHDGYSAICTALPPGYHSQQWKFVHALGDS